MIPWLLATQLKNRRKEENFPELLFTIITPPFWLLAAELKFGQQVTDQVMLS